MCGVYCEHTWRAQQAIHQYVVKGGGDVLGMRVMGEVIAKYPKLTGENKVGALVGKLAQEALLGKDVMNKGAHRIFKSGKHYIILS